MVSFFLPLKSTRRNYSDRLLLVRFIFYFLFFYDSSHKSPRSPIESHPVSGVSGSGAILENLHWKYGKQRISGEMKEVCTVTVASLSPVSGG